jgi:glycerate-2-kinase
MIKNSVEIVGNAENKKIKRAREIALQLLGEAINAAHPGKLVAESLSSLKLEKHSKIYVAGFGKACGAMVAAVEKKLDVSGGVIIVPKGMKVRTEKIEVVEGGHPFPDEQSVGGANEILELIKNCERDALILILISGGGSALFAKPADGVTLEDKNKITKSLLKSGCSIRELNIVRKHISAVKGGQLAKACHPRKAVSLILSDVVGDDLGVIASGPTVPDETTFSDAEGILKKYNLWAHAPQSIRRRVDLGSRGMIEETPKKEFSTRNIIVGNNLSALSAAKKAAKKMGLNAVILSHSLEGEARNVGGLLANAGKSAFFMKPTVILSGGETTVTVRGNGKGGRNQELVLGASLYLQGEDVVVASIGTDGIDGPTDAAGAIADGATVKRAQNKKMAPMGYLAENNSYPFFKKLGDLLFTGPTGTNVMDVQVTVVL